MPPPAELREQLPLLLPRAVAWAEEQSRRGSEEGQALGDLAASLARAVGVRKPEKVRLLLVDEFPQPADPELRAAAEATGLLNKDTAGLTLGYTILLRRGLEGSPRLLRHELRHVHQYEKAGSIAAFLAEYLRQIVEHGYADAPFEADARDHETR